MPTIYHLTQLTRFDLRNECKLFCFLLAGLLMYIVSEEDRMHTVDPFLHDKKLGNVS